MTPERFAQTIVSIEHNYGLMLDARSVWLRMDATPCGRGWVGTKPGCKRGKATAATHAKVPTKVPETKPDQPALLPVKQGGTIAKAKTRTKKSKTLKVDPKNQKATTQSPSIEASNSRRSNGKHEDIPDDAREQSLAIQKLTGMSADEAKSSIKAIKDYASLSGDGVVSYGAIRNVQRGILEAAEGPPHYGNPLTKPETAKIQSSIDSIDRYVKRMPAFEGVIHRGMSFKSEDERTSFLSKISKGYSLEAMSSFSSSREIAENFAGDANGIIFAVKNKSGASIQQLSGEHDEEEVLVPKGVKYKIVGKPKKIGYVVVVQMKEI